MKWVYNGSLVTKLLAKTYLRTVATERLKQMLSRPDIVCHIDVREITWALICYTPQITLSVDGTWELLVRYWYFRDNEMIPGEQSYVAQTSD